MKKLAGLLLMPLLLSGCWDAHEVEHMIYAQGVGTDFKNNKIIMYAQTIDFGNIAKKESGGEKGAQKVWIGKGEGHTVNQAFSNLLESTPQRIHFGHVNHVVFTEAALKQKGLLEQLFDTFDRFPESRQTPWVFGTKESLESVFSNIPIFNLSPLYSLISNPMGKYRQKSFFRPYQLYRLESNFHEPGSTVLLLGVSISDKNWTENTNIHPMLIRDEIFLFNKDGGYKGYLPHNKALGIRWMQEETEIAELAMPDEDKPEFVAFLQRPKHQIIPILDGESPKFKIKIKVQGNVIEMKKPLSEEGIEKQAEKAIKHDVMETYKEALKLHADVFEFSQTLYRMNPKAWEKVAVNNELPLSVDSLESIEVDVKIASGDKLKLKQK